jgi:hypothetical protein
MKRLTPEREQEIREKVRWNQRTDVVGELFDEIDALRVEKALYKKKYMKRINY